MYTCVSVYFCIPSYPVSTMQSTHSIEKKLIHFDSLTSKAFRVGRIWSTFGTWCGAIVFRSMLIKKKYYFLFHLHYYFIRFSFLYLYSNNRLILSVINPFFSDCFKQWPGHLIWIKHVEEKNFKKKAKKFKLPQVRLLASFQLPSKRPVGLVNTQHSAFVIFRYWHLREVSEFPFHANNYFSGIVVNSKKLLICVDKKTNKYLSWSSKKLRIFSNSR